MPKLPQMTATGPAGVLALPRADSESFGSQAGDSVQRLGHAFAYLDRHIQAQQDDLDFTFNRNKYDVALSQQYQAVLADPSLPTPKDKVQKLQDLMTEFRRDQATGASGKDAVSGAVIGALMKHDSTQMAHAEINLHTDARKQQVSQQRADVLTASDQLTSKEGTAIAQDDMAARIQANTERADLFNRAEKNLTYTPEEMLKVRERASNNLWEFVAEQRPDFFLGKKGVKARVAAGGSAPPGMDLSMLRHYENISQQTMNGQNAELVLAQKRDAAELLAAQDVTKQHFLESIKDGSPNVGALTKEILRSNLDVAGPSSKEHYIEMLQTRAKELKEQSTFSQDHVLMAKTILAINRNDVPSVAVLDDLYLKSAQRNRGITYEGLVHLRKEWEQMRTPEGRQLGEAKANFYKAMEPPIQKPGPFGIYADPSTPAQYTRFIEDTELLIAQYRQQGKSPFLLFDPKSPEYRGRPAVVKQYQNTGFGSTQAAPPPPPSTPGATRPSLDDIFGVKK